MSNSTPLTPKKLKDQLTSLRESIASLDNNNGNTFGAPWAFFTGVALLLTTELASRGVHYTLPPIADFSCSHLILLLDAIHNTAGKPSIDEDACYPPQLIAALYAASGMAAAATISTLSNPRKIDNAVQQASERSMKRCREVNDGRFYAILMLLCREEQGASQDQIINDIAYSNFLYGASQFAVDQVPMWKRCLDCALSGGISEDSGGSDGKENHRSYMSSKTILPLQNMMRVAQSKQNFKRVEELRIWLVCGYIGATRERLGCINQEKIDEKAEDVGKKSIEELVNNFFLRRCATFVELENLDVTRLLDLARDSLDACSLRDVEVDQESRLLYHYLQVQIQYLSEECKIWLEVQRQIRAMKNRLPEKETKSGGSSTIKSGISLKDDKVASSLSSTTVNTANREEIEEETRRNVLLDAWSAWWSDSSNRELNSLSILGLRDVFVLSSSFTTLSTSSDLLEDCHYALEHQVQRLLDMAVSLQRKRNREKKGKHIFSPDALLTCWEALFSFVSPLMMDYFSLIIKKYSEDEKISIKESLRRLLECAAQAIVSAAWMCEPLVKTFSVDNRNVVIDCIEFRHVPRLLSIAHRCLTLCRKERSTRDQQTMDSPAKIGSVFSSSDRHTEAEKMELLLLEGALASTKIQVDLATLLNADENGNSDDTTPNELSLESLTAVAHKATVSAASSKPGSELKIHSLTLHFAHAKFGATFLQFMSSWSGLYLTPWPFCSLGQGRSIICQARESLSEAGTLWGREAGFSVENIVMDIAEADLEGGIAGGFVHNAKILYERTLKQIATPTAPLGIGSHGIALLKAHCCIGLARLFIKSETSESELYARDAVEILRKAEADEGIYGNCSLIYVYAWDDISLYNFARSYHECMARQLVAEAIRSSHPEDARYYLFEAVKADPSNFDATFALAAFLLRTMIFNTNENGNDAALKNETKNLLLKSAKIGKNKPSPFALLGMFYELQDDVPRAIGCHKKALSMDPSHPVSGRGLLRLVSIEEMKPFCEAATKRNSPANGWAWRLLGQIRSRKDGDYSSAVICFQLALRCRDVKDPEKDLLGAFYNDPKKGTEDAGVTPTGNCEAGETWSELASCYRQLGKWSGSFRAYDAAYTVSKGNLSPDSLVAWAQVELELGLYNEAVKRCDEALLSSRHVPKLQRFASYVKGQAILAVARQDIQEGKYGSCLGHIKTGLELEGRSYCELKLLGDLCSLSEALPPYVFVEDATFSSYEGFEGLNNETSIEIKRKLSLLERGVSSYAKALELAKTCDFDKDRNNCLVASAAIDLGSILLAQARVISLALGDGSGGGTHTTVADLVGRHEQLRNIVNESINVFLCAIDLSPNEAHAWCGIGCALAAIDPLKAQHSFARALQLDKSYAEAWSNTGVLFAGYDLREKGSEILDALTQAEDTPFMWICRGFLFERSSDAWQNQVSSRESNLAKAADAYRAALQLFQHPSALLGLSLTCRRNDNAFLAASDALYSMLATEASKAECILSVSIHQNISGHGNLLAGYVNSFMQMERCLDHATSCHGKDVDDILQRANADVKSLNVVLYSTTATDVTTEGRCEPTQFEIDCDSRLPLKAKRTGKLLPETIDAVIAKVSSVSSIHTAACAAANHSSLRTHQNIDVNDSRNRVYLNPDSGEEWLVFAKALAEELCTIENGSNNHQPQCFSQALASGKAAALRAHKILYDSVVHASTISPACFATQGASMDRSEVRVVSRVASASIVSEAMSLVSWMEDFECLHTEEPTTVYGSVSMQEAYLLDPINILALNALGLSSS